MGIIDGKRITVSNSRRNGCSDAAICEEEVQNRKYFVFLSTRTAKKIQQLTEDLVMRKIFTNSIWRFEEARRIITVKITRNRSNIYNTLMIKKDAKQWRRRVYIPAGYSGEG